MTDSALDRTCDKYGCAKVALDPKLHEFDDCFQGGIRFGDIDGAVERHGFILWLEWKVACNFDEFEDRHKAQLIQARAFTRNSDKHTFIFVIGDPVLMRVDAFRVMQGGAWKWEWIHGDTDRLKSFLRWWFQFANNSRDAA